MVQVKNRLKVFIIICFCLVSLLFFVSCGSDGNKIETSDNFVVQGETISGSVSNDVDVFSVYNVIRGGKGYSWELYSDAECLRLISSKTVSLSIGNNTFYVLLRANGDRNSVKLYKLVIRRKPIFQVSFETSGGTTIANQSIEEGCYAYQPYNPEREGCEFDGWDRSFDIPIMSNTVFNAKWNKNTYTITFDSNGGSNVNSIIAVYDSDIYEPTYPTKLNYIFAGWFTDKQSLEEEFDEFSKMPARNVQLYAKWLSPKIYTKNDIIQISRCKSTWCQDITLYSDIDLGGCEWSPIGNQNKAYTGTFNGNGYSISNFVLTQDTHDHVADGFFGYVYNAKITNLRIKNISITHKVDCNTYTGGLAGYSYCSDISQCSVEGDISIDGIALRSYTDVGGLVGYFSEGIIINCYTSGSVSIKEQKTYYFVGGLVGMADAMTLSNSYSICDVNCDAYDYSFIGGIVGSLKDSSVRSVFISDSLISSPVRDAHLGAIYGYTINSEVMNCRITDDVRLRRLNYESGGQSSSPHYTVVSKDTLWTQLGYSWDSDYWNIYSDKHPTLK